ncbi:MAG: sulfatase-like hydrolase/transferase, partial [Planctomycetes bacterium]|nr:sulfatase-like hydrolase/transferase [Planctomycetota bacterium]
MSARRLAKIALGIVTAALLGGVAWLSGRSTPRMSVVLFTVDTVRADALGAYGAPAGRTPNLDGFAQEAVVFERAYTTAPLTLPAHASILTGLYPRSHGVRRNVDFRLPEHTDTLATALHASGYRTAAFVSSIVLGRAFGLDGGFDLYDDVSAPRATERRAPETAARAIEWLRASPPEPFFLWVHFYDAHAPYDPPPALRERFTDPYAGEIALVDQEIGHVLERLDAEGFGDRTIVVVAGDHGEDRMQHGEPEHGVFLYDSVLHVPLLVRAPGRRDVGRRDATVVSLVDVCPTVLELVDVSFPYPLQGRALLLRSGTPKVFDHSVLAETTFAASVYGWSPLDAFVRGSWKLIDGPRPELFDLAHDAGETRDLAGVDAARLQEMRSHFTKARDALHRPSGDVTFRPTVADRAALESLGYVSGRPDDAPLPASAPDPKSVIGVLPLLSAGRAALHAGHATEAIPPLRQAARIDPRNPRVLDALGAAQHAAGQLEEARATLESALAIDPNSPEIVTNLGATLDALGDRASAENAYRRAITLEPTRTAAQMDLLLLLVESERFREALAQAEVVHRLRSDHPLPLLLSGRCREALGDSGGARSDYGQAATLAEARDDSADSLLAGAEAAYR